MKQKQKNHRTNIIAEIGVNHNGDYETAKKLIKIAKICGADFAKFQMYEPDEMVTDSAKKANYQNSNMGKKLTQKKMLKKYYMNFKKIKNLKNYCDKIGINFMASVFDEISLRNYLKLNPKYLKLPSPEINNYFLINKIKNIKKKISVLFSIGMSNTKDILNFYRAMGKKENLVPMYCVSSYPTKISEVNLKKIISLKKNSKTFGLSDHTESFETSIISTFLGANFIERHITLNKNQKGPDHSSSLDPNQFKMFINSVRNTETLVSNKKIEAHEEHKNKKYVRKFLVAKKKINKGEKFSFENVTCKRSGKIGLDPFSFVKINNRKSKRSFTKDELIK